MKPLVLYCKSYSTDLRRVVRLAKSIQLYNMGQLPFYVSVPKVDIPLFRTHLAGLNVKLIVDEEILAASPRLDTKQVALMPGNISQQIVKSEFWRLNISDMYLCLDSDSVFIRTFNENDFITADGTPYSVMNEAHALFELAITNKKQKIVENFQKDAAQVQAIFGRVGKAYSFGPMPMVWHRLVWESLDINFLQPQGMNFMDAIRLAPLESRWYGEALLKYKSIDVLPTDSFFKVYHYAWQLDRDKKANLGLEELGQLYTGVIYQSSWEREMDWPAEGGSWMSHFGRKLRRKLGRI
jgi:Family of unknown function (DUF6492)